MNKPVQNLIKMPQNVQTPKPISISNLFWPTTAQCIQGKNVERTKENHERLIFLYLVFFWKTLKD